MGNNCGQQWLFESKTDLILIEVIAFNKNVLGFVFTIFILCKPIKMSAFLTNKRREDVTRLFVQYTVDYF